MREMKSTYTLSVFKVGDLVCQKNSHTPMTVKAIKRKGHRAYRRPHWPYSEESFDLITCSDACGGPDRTFLAKELDFCFYRSSWQAAVLDSGTFARLELYGDTTCRLEFVNAQTKTSDEFPGTFVVMGASIELFFTSRTLSNWGTSKLSVSLPKKLRIGEDYSDGGYLLYSHPDEPGDKPGDLFGQHHGAFKLASLDSEALNRCNIAGASATDHPRRLESVKLLLQILAVVLTIIATAIGIAVKLRSGN